MVVCVTYRFRRRGIFIGEKSLDESRFPNALLSNYDNFRVRLARLIVSAHMFSLLLLCYGSEFRSLSVEK